MKLVAADLRELLKLSAAKLAPLLGEGAAYGGAKASEKEVCGSRDACVYTPSPVPGGVSGAKDAPLSEPCGLPSLPLPHTALPLPTVSHPTTTPPPPLPLPHPAPPRPASTVATS